jgi:hypothetical protein
MKWAAFEETIGSIDEAREILRQLVAKYPMLLEARYRMHSRDSLRFSLQPVFSSVMPYCGYRFGIRCLVDPWIRDLWDHGMGKKSRIGSGINILEHISDSLKTIFRVKILEFLDADADPDPGFGNLFEPGSGMEKIRIRDTG